MNRINLILGTYNGQPVGCPDEVFERAYQRAYRPFLTTLYQHPDVPAVLHYSGILLEWIENRHPEFIMLLDEMAKRRQVEILGGGYYEPVLPLIPNADKIGQVEALTTFLRKRFGKRPRGFWLAEQVWEPNLASILASSGMDYTFLNEHIYRAAGLVDEEIDYPCITEDQGKTLIVFPIHTALVESIHVKTPAAVLERILGETDGRDERTIVLFERGERMGLWNSSHERFYEGRWLDEFLALLGAPKAASEGAESGSEPSIEVTTPGRYLKQHYPARKAYFPCTSYDEIMKWVLEPERQVQLERFQEKVSKKNQGFVRGGFFRQFLSRYPESNLMYAKMMYTHLLVNQVRGDRARRRAAREDLWKGQCHYAYWHGCTGGLYENHLRKAIYASLLGAERTTRESASLPPAVLSVDFDMDGGKEFLFQGKNINAYVHPKGGVLFELDWQPGTWNFLDTLGRHREVYHTEQEEKDGYDHTIRRGFHDHFYALDESFENFRRNAAVERGQSGADVYRAGDTDRGNHELDLFREAALILPDASGRIAVLKRYHFSSDGLEVTHFLKNVSERRLSFLFVSETNLALSSVGDNSVVRKAGEGGELEMLVGDASVRQAWRVSIRDEGVGAGVEMETGTGTTLWHYILRTKYMGLTGMESAYQADCFAFLRRLDLDPGTEETVRIGLRIRAL